MGLLNYSTQINETKTISEIESMLASSGAQRILKDYDGSGKVTSISFIIQTKHGALPIKMPMNLQAVMQVINNQTKQYTKKGYDKRLVVPKKFYNDMDQARRVGWRILKDWLESQLALIQLEMVEIQQIFLPYIVGKDGKTLYEHLAGINFKGYLLENQTIKEDEE